LPNITNVFYGRDVGYSVERIVLDDTTELMKLMSEIFLIKWLAAPLLHSCPVLC